MNEMIRIAVVLAAGVIGSVGFALIFGVAKKHFIFALLSAVISCLAFELVALLGWGMFLSAFIGAGLAAAYSDIMAHRIKTPATVMIIIGMIPLVPGARLYYTMLGMFSSNGETALLIAAGIAVGIITVTAISRPINAKISEINSKKHKSKG